MSIELQAIKAVARNIDLEAVLREHVPQDGTEPPFCRSCNVTDVLVTPTVPWPCLPSLLALRAFGTEQTLDRIVASQSVLTVPPGADVRPTDTFASIEEHAHPELGGTVEVTEPGMPEGLGILGLTIGQRIEISLLDGSTLQGDVLKVGGDETITLEGSDGTPTVWPLSEIARIEPVISDE